VDRVDLPEAAIDRPLPSKSVASGFPFDSASATAIAIASEVPEKPAFAANEPISPTERSPAQTART